jgi:hypothetical protein
MLGERQCEFNDHIGRHISRVPGMFTISIPLLLKLKFYQFLSSMWECSWKARTADVFKYLGRVDVSWNDSGIFICMRVMTCEYWFCMVSFSEAGEGLKLTHRDLKEQIFS